MSSSLKTLSIHSHRFLSLPFEELTAGCKGKGGDAGGCIELVLNSSFYNLNIINKNYFLIHSSLPFMTWFHPYGGGARVAVPVPSQSVCWKDIVMFQQPRKHS